MKKWNSPSVDGIKFTIPFLYKRRKYITNTMMKKSETLKLLMTLNPSLHCFVEEKINNKDSNAKKWNSPSVNYIKSSFHCCEEKETTNELNNQKAVTHLRWLVFNSPFHCYTKRKWKTNTTMQTSGTHDLLMTSNSSFHFCVQEGSK